MFRTALGYKKILLVLLACFILSTCAAPRRDIEPTFDNIPQKASIPDAAEILGQKKNEPIFSVPLAKNIFVPRPLEASDPLPEIPIKSFSAVDATVLETFRLLVLDEGISVTAGPDFKDKRITLFDMNGTLQQVLDRISETTGVYYVYKNNLLTVTPMRTFIVSLPPIEATFDGIAGVLASFGAEKVSIDKSSRILVFEANRQSYENIRKYLNQVKENKVLIVYETYVMEVELDDENQIGINWSNLEFTPDNSYAFTSSGGSLISAASQTFVFGATKSGSGTFNFNSALQFLRTQGNVEIISRPTLTLISGNTASFEVGRETTYVSEVETTFQLLNNEERPVTSVTPDVVVTGLKMGLTADYVDETIYSQVTLEIADLVGLPTQSFSTGLVDDDMNPIQNSVTLPITTTRSLTTTVRARPGDTILMAGINQSRDESAHESLPLIDSSRFSTGKETQANRSEIVIIMTPRVIRFDSPAEEEPVKAAAPTGVVQPSAADAQAPVPLLTEEDYDHLPTPRPAPAMEGEAVEPAKLLQEIPASSMPDALPDLGEAPAVENPAATSDEKAAETSSPAPATGDGDPFFGKVQYFHKDGSVQPQ